MKKILTVLIATVLVVLASFALVGCGENTNSSDTKSGLSYKKEKDGGYVITSYKEEKDEENNVITTLDIGKIKEELKFDEGDKKEVRIKKNAFNGNASLEKIIVPSFVTEIEEGAFANMSKLQTLEVPFIGRTAKADAYEGATSESADKSANSARTIAHFFGTNSYDEGKSITINYGSSTKTCYVPVTFSEVIVNAESDYVLPMHAFDGAINLTSVVLKGKITAIGESAFNGVKNIKEIKLPATVSVIYDNAFNSAIKLEKVIFEKGSKDIEIKDKAFMDAFGILYLGGEEEMPETLNERIVDMKMIKSVGNNTFEFGDDNVKYIVKNKIDTINNLAEAFASTEYEIKA